MDLAEISIKRERRFKLWVWISCLIAIASAACLFWWPTEPTYQGKRISGWFEEAVESYAQSPNDPNATSFQAFREIEGDAVYFLVGWMEARPTPLDEVYETIFRRLPPALTKLLPQPRDARYYAGRSATALELLQWIGMEQRFKTEIWGPTERPLFPNLRT